MKKPVSHAGSDTIICAATPAFLHGFGSNFSGPLIYNWTPRIPLFAFTSVDSSQAIVRPDSSMDFVFNVRDNYGCSFSVFDTMRVFIDPPVPAFAGNDTNALLGKPHHMKATGGVAYEWTPTAPLDNPNIPNPTAILYNDTYFRVTVTDAAGCKGSDDVFLKVYDGPAYYLPNAFTPDNNGINDIFYPTTVGMKFTDFFMIYDRYGEIMFQTREFQKGWDGTYKGKPALMGTYVWIIKGTDEKGKVVEMRGTVTLIR
jgi:gliding motility-associated-like protein